MLNNKDIPSWYILGTGAIGTLFAAKLLKQSIPCTLLHRSSDKKMPRHLQITNLDNSHQSLPINIDHISSQLPIERLILCTKSYQSEAAIRSIRGRLTKNAHIVLLQNGMGQQQSIAKILSSQVIIAATTTQGALLNNPLDVTHTGNGDSVYGLLNTATTIDNNVCDTLSRIGMQQVTDINIRLWRKLKINCVINPLTAMHNCSNGDIINNAKLYQQVIFLCKEIDDVDKALKLETHIPILTQVTAIALATATNYSSMHQDIQHKRRTEIDFINGYLQQLALQHAIKTPLNRQYICDIKALEST
ncbi:MAG: 2-dehydropantoate 2-reductase [Oceanospirillaceae bacterium]|nr:2-dehydropantoate 2-reductase [Oceanospirillaceae bacterium]